MQECLRPVNVGSRVDNWGLIPLCLQVSTFVGLKSVAIGGVCCREVTDLEMGMWSEMLWVKLSTALRQTGSLVS